MTTTATKRTKTTGRKATTGTRRAGLYVRISKDRDAQDSTAIQENACRRYCEAKGWKVIDVYEDRGRSAYKRSGRRDAQGVRLGVHRPSLERLITDAEAGVIDTVIVYKIDRISRSTRDFANLWARLQNAGCEFVATDNNFDTSSAMGKAMLDISMTFAELESGIKSERISAVHEYQQAEGRAPTGPRPFGYNADRTIEPTEAKLIREAARTILRGGSLRGIVGDWNARGIVNARGAQWTNRALRFVLASPHTAGLRDADGTLVAGRQWKGVLDRATHEKLVTVLDDPTRRTTSGNARAHLLTGIATCGLCGTPLATKPHLNGVRYVCGPRRGHEGCGKLSIQAAGADATITAVVIAELEKSKAGIAAAADGRRSDPGALVDQLDAELSVLAADYGRGDLSRAEWQAARQGIETRRDEAQRAEGRAHSTSVLRKLRSGNITTKFASLSIDDQRLVLLAVLDRVEIDTVAEGRERALAAAERGDKYDQAEGLACRVRPIWRV